MNNNSKFDGVFIHETSFIDNNVKIQEGTKIWHFSHFLKNCKIGKDCSFGQNVVVGPNVIIGDNVKVQNNVSIYEGVTLEDGVFCGPSCVFTNVKNPRSEITRKNEYKKTLVRRGATLGANCTIVCGISIGAYAFIGAGAVIINDIPDYALMAGVPAKHIGWISEYGEKLDLPLKGSAEALCKNSNKKYQLKDDFVSLVD
jgi:UDP-2-acetamido-3-amino-2,3-dideoxy-glucuronate N-acetyltransferase